MNPRVLRTLLWKDYRVHRPVLILGGMLLLLPYFGGFLGILLSGRESTAAWVDAETIAGMSYTSLILSLLTMVGLAGSAFTAERENRASEFLACLPTSRWMNLCSKIVLMTTVILLLNLANLAVLFILKPHLSNSSEIDHTLGTLSLMVPVGMLFFGAAWLASAWLRQSTVAAACGLAAPVVVAAGFHGFHIALAPEILVFGDIYRGVCLVLGLFSFVAGCAVYLVRFEP